MNKYLQMLNKEDCCGCSSCVQACPKHALTMIKDVDGFSYPQIDADSCIRCGKCATVCPMEKESRNESTRSFHAFAAYSNRNEYIHDSSSGGIFPEIAACVIQNGGVVYGAAMDENFNVLHKRISQRTDIPLLQGSKYVQSDMGEIFPKCKDDLINGKMVLFTGTGCQIYGLKRYLGKEYDNLLTADVICHGVPSNLFFKQYIRFLEQKHKGKLTEICFRDKRRNGWSITQRYQIQRGKNVKDYFLNRELSEYFTAFLGGMIARESCYTCPFATLDRPADITMGDFWGYQRTRPELAHKEGLSLLLVNTEKGMQVIKTLQGNGVGIHEVSYESVEKSDNKNLYIPTKRPIERDSIYQDLHSHGFEFIAKKYCRNSRTWKSYIKNTFLYSMWKAKF